MEWYLSVALLLALVGAVLIAAEFFVPTGGILVVAAVAVFAAAVGLIFLYGETLEGLLAVIALCLGLPIAGWLLFTAYRRLALDPKLTNTDAADAVADELGIGGLNELVNSFGKTLSPMRPAGIVELDGRRIDAVTEGRMLEADTPVRCIGIRGTVVVVRSYESKPTTAKIDDDELL